MNIVKIENLSKSYGDKTILKDLNLEISKPGIYALIGPNGSGKTTLFNILANLTKADSGEVYLFDEENDESTIFSKVSFLIDTNILYGYLSGFDHLLFIESAQKLDKERKNIVIDKLHLSSFIHKKVSQYSLGMKQKLLIAMTLMNNPRLIILDEPFNGLDPTSLIQIRSLLVDLAKDGTTIIISSHGLTDISLLTGNILFLKDGKLIEEEIKMENEYQLLEIEEKYLEVFPEQKNKI